MQNFALFVNLHTVLISILSQPVQVSVQDGSLFCVHLTTQFVIGKLTDAAFTPIIQIIYENVEP